MWSHMNTYGGGWGMGFGMLLMGVLIVIGIVVLMRSTSGSGPQSPPHSKSALDVLKERYARGEINKQEFEEKKHDVK